MEDERHVNPVPEYVPQYYEEITTGIQHGSDGDPSHLLLLLRLFYPWRPFYAALLAERLTESVINRFDRSAISIISAACVWPMAGR